MSKKKRRYSEVVALPGFVVSESKNGFPQLEVPLQIVECSDRTRVGEKLFMYQIVKLESDDSVKWAVELLRNLGMTNTNILEPEGLGSVRASCCEEQETYEGKTSFRAKYINEIKARESITGTAADEFSARLSAAFSQAEPVSVGDHNRPPESLPETTDGQPSVANDLDDIFS